MIVKIGNRIINYDGKFYSTTVGGTKVKFNSFNDLKRRIIIFDSDKGIRKGKRILEKYR